MSSSVPFLSAWQCHAVTGVTFMARALRCEDSDGSQRHTPVIDTILPMTLLYLLSSSEKPILTLYLWGVIEFEVQCSKYYSYVHARNKTFDVGLDIRVNITFWYWNCMIGTNWHFKKISSILRCLFVFSFWDMPHKRSESLLSLGT